MENEKRSTLAYKLIILGIAVGLLITAQWKTPLKRSVNPLSPYLSLRQTRDDLTKDQQRLKSSISKLQKQIDTSTILANQNLTSRTLSNQAQNLKERIGLTEIHQSGIIITLDDSPQGGASTNITHAADLRDIINLLWQNGAKAISINNERVVANTSIDCIVNTILINNTRTTPPYKILAVGDVKKLESALNDHRNLSDLWKRVDKEGVIFKIQTNWRLTIPAFNGSFILHYAKEDQTI